MGKKRGSKRKSNYIVIAHKKRGRRPYRTAQDITRAKIYKREFERLYPNLKVTVAKGTDF
jgi:hypothetical protein